MNEACQIHDITYAKNKDIRSRNITDEVPADKAWARMEAKYANKDKK